MVKRILTVLMLAVLLRENSSKRLVTNWQLFRDFCSFQKPSDCFDATVYPTCLWKKWNIFNGEGEFDGPKVSRFLSVEFGTMEDYLVIKSGMQNCLTKVIGTTLEERCYSLWNCLKTADLIRLMDKDRPEGMPQMPGGSVKDFYEV